MAALAERQHGVVAGRQLVALGFGRGWIEHKLRIGWLQAVFRGVYAVGHGAIGVDGRALAAVLACGPNAYLSHVWAAWHWRLLERTPFAIDVVVAGHRSGQPGIRTHRARILHPSEVAVHRGIPVTNVPRTLLDLAAGGTERQLRRAMNQAVRAGQINRRVLAELCERHRGRPGIVAFREAVAAVTPSTRRTRSDLEVAFESLCLKHRLPRPLINGQVEGFEVDAHFPGTLLIVELDFYDFHRTRTEFANDRYRDAQLKLKGYEVLRIPDRWLDDDPDGVAATVRGLLERSASRAA